MQPTLQLQQIWEVMIWKVRVCVILLMWLIMLASRFLVSQEQCVGRWTIGSYIWEYCDLVMSCCLYCRWFSIKYTCLWFYLEYIWQQKYFCDLLTSWYSFWAAIFQAPLPILFTELIILNTQFITTYVMSVAIISFPIQFYFKYYF